MPTCSKDHPINIVCLDRCCYFGERNPLVRLQRRLDRVDNENKRLKALWDKRTATKAG